MGPKPRPVAERFWSKVRKADGDGCWLWGSYCDRRGGYGIFVVRSGPTRTEKAHRMAYLLTYGGACAAGLVVRHRCDNPGCVRPGHLVLGTQSDNIRDMVERGRSSRGANHWRSRLTVEMVRDIRRSREAGETIESIRRRLGVSRSAVSFVLSGRTWGHVAD